MTLKAITLAGPTAVGKTDLSMTLAKSLKGVIINADSMQIYDVLRVVSARPSGQEMGTIPHRLFGDIDPAKAYSVADWQAAAMDHAEEAWENGMTPLFTGGTGMYFTSLLDGMSSIPEIDPDIRQNVRARAEEEGSEVLHAELEKLDREIFERLSPGDSQRVSRALEVVLSTGKPLSQWQKENIPGPLKGVDIAGRVLKIVLSRPREQLYERINQRFAEMFESGAVDEVKALLDRGLDKNLPAMKALGVPSIVAYLQGDMEKSDAIVDAQQQTRRFAKRQMTWFRQQFSDWHVLDLTSATVEQELAALINDFKGL